MDDTDRYRDVVRSTAESLGLLDAAGRLVPLDSLMIVDYVMALEEAASVQVPVALVRNAHFESLESVAKMLAQV